MSDLDVLRQRVPVTTCARCRKALAPGDRVIAAFIMQKIARNPETRELGAMLGAEFELVHADCRMPSLDGSLIVL